MIDQSKITALIDWMIEGARSAGDARDFSELLCRKLIAAGVPVDRYSLFIYTLHPNLVGWRFLWSPDQGVLVSQGKMGLFSTEEYLANPLPTVIEKQRPIRRRLADPDSPNDYKLIDELIADGFTDYLVQPIIYTNSETNVVSWSTKVAGGFTDEAVAVLERINAPLARLTETYLLRINAAAILSAYVGRNGGDQILKGKVHRGDGEEIEGAILFTDIAGFTELSNAMNGSEVVALINDAFDLMVPAVEERGGEILNFLGDGFFAIFPHRQDGMAESAAAAAQAVLEAEGSLIASDVGKRVAIRSAIHAGRFHYGNIGGASRLDFTAIGRPINFTARLMTAASDFGLKRVTSALVAPHLGLPTQLAQTVQFKGFSEPQLVFTY